MTAIFSLTEIVMLMMGAAFAGAALAVLVLLILWPKP